MSMSKVIAVAGKGGVGKTTTAALLVGALVRRKSTPVLAIDADPNSCLAEGLGIEVDQTLGAIRDDIMEKKDKIPPGMSKQQLVDLHSHQCVAEGTGFDLLVMGRTEGPGCYCYVNDLLRGFMERLEPNYPFTVMDNEAGMEHLSRRTARRVDHLLVVADGSLASLKAAERIRDLVIDLKIDVGSKHLLLNRRGEGEERRIEGLPTLARIPRDPEVEKAEAAGNSLLMLAPETPAATAVDGILDQLFD
ncbi:MAG: ATP-binding protein [Planctomycetota bacterium]|jgi:CO dehydrogenase maturation factor